LKREYGVWFKTEIESQQGDAISPLGFITLLERVMEAVECESEPAGMEYV